MDRIFMKNSITKEATNELSFAQPQKIYLFETNQEELVDNIELS